MRNLIEGYNELEQKLGYKPNFHDDYIEQVIINKDRIIFDLKTVDKVYYSLIFEDVKEIDLKGEILGTIGIIFELDIKSVEGVITTYIQSSLGLYGKIASKRIIVK